MDKVPWDGHTLAVHKPMTAIVGKVYQGVQVDGVRILRSRQRRGVTRTMKAMIKRRSAIEPTTVGHMKSEGRLARNPPKGTLGGALHAVMRGAGHNSRLLLKKLRLFCALLGIDLPAMLDTPRGLQRLQRLAVA